MWFFLIRIIKAIYFRVSELARKWKKFIKVIVNFFLPNISQLIHNRILFKQLPVCNQKTRFTGSGITIIDANCIFGYKMGGNFYKGITELQPRYKKSKIVIGKRVATNNNLFLCAANYIEIGDDTLIGQGVTIMDHEGHGIDPGKRRQIGEIGEVIIGRNVWLGNNVIVLKNTVIGNNTIVAAGAVVSGTFPADVIIGGVPAKIIRQL